MKILTEKLNFTNQTIKEMKKNSIDFYNNIKNRRSVRDFKEKKFNIDILKNAILAAGTAPNGANLQPWQFVIVKNKRPGSLLSGQIDKDLKVGERNITSDKKINKFLDVFSNFNSKHLKKTKTKINDKCK